MRNILTAKPGSSRATAVRWLIGLAVLAVSVGIQMEWPAFGAALKQWLAVRSARFASSYLEAAGTNHLLTQSEVLLPGHRFSAAELHQHFTSWICVLGFTVAYLIVARRRPIRSVMLLASLPVWSVLAGAATVFAAVQSADGSLVSLDSTAVQIAHALFMMLVVLAFDQLLGVLWFVGKFVGFVAVRVIGILVGLVVLALAQLWRLSRSKKGNRRKAGWTNRARALLRGPGLHRFLRGEEHQQLLDLFRSKRAKRKRADVDAATLATQPEPSQDQANVAGVKESKRSRKTRRFLPRGWTRTIRKRPSLRIPLALPAVALLLAAGFGQLRWSQLIRGELSPRYQRVAVVAFDRRDYAAADLYYRKLRQLDKSSAQAIYGQALVAQRTGDQEKATQLMEEIAPPDRGGYPQAHVWLAKSIAEGRPTMDPDTATAYRLHLIHAVESDPNHKEAHALLGLFMQATNRYEQAIRHLEAAVDRRPDLWLNLATAYAARRMIDKAMQAATNAVDHYTRVTRDEPQVAEHRIRWANALVFLAEFDKAEATLKDGLAGVNGYRFRAALVRIYASWFDFLARQPNIDEKLLLKVGGKGLTLAPDNGPLLQRVAVLVYFGETPEDEREMLPPIHAKVAASPEALLALGSEFIKRQGYSKAVVLLELALQLKPKSPEILNNLAWALLQANRPQLLTRALQLIDEAIEQYPQNPHLRDTRGQILVKLGRYKDALADLEIALPLLNHNPRLHLALATVYAKLGMSVLAERHKRLATPQGG